MTSLQLSNFIKLDELDHVVGITTVSYTHLGDLQQQVLLPVYTAFPFNSLTTQKLFKETLTAQS